MWPFTKRSTKKDVSLDQLLELTKVLVDRSDESFYSGYSPAEISADLAVALSAIERGETLNKNTLRMHFGPTGPIQETAMESGWADEYLRLADLFDGAIEQVR